MGDRDRELVAGASKRLRKLEAEMLSPPELRDLVRSRHPRVAKAHVHAELMLATRIPQGA